MSLVNRKKRNGAELADATRSANLFKGDDAKVEQLCQRLKKSPAEVIRQLVSEALIHRELSTRESEAAVGINQQAIDGLLSERLRPVLQELHDLKGCMRELGSTTGDQQPSTTPQAHVIAEQLLKELNTRLYAIYDQIEAHHSKFIEVAQILHRRTECAERWSQGAYALNGNTFTWMWAMLDLLQRYVVVPQLNAMDPEADALKIVETEIEASCAVATKKRNRLERRLKVPKDAKVKFLSAPHE